MDQPASTALGSDAASPINAGTISSDRPNTAAQARLAAVIAVARHHGLDLHVGDFRAAANETVPSPASLVGLGA